MIPDVDLREAAINLAIVLVTVMVVLAGFEVGLRTGVVDSGITQYRICDGSDTISPFEYNATYGWTATPNHEYMIRKDSRHEWVRYENNDEGFRDKYDSGNRSVIVLGDSFAYGYLADDNSTFPHLLDRWTPNTTFENYGVSAYSTGQEYVLYSKKADTVNYSSVVLAYYPGNDMVANVNKHNFPERPIFEVINGELQMVGGTATEEEALSAQPRDPSTIGYPTNRLLVKRYVADRLPSVVNLLQGSDEQSEEREYLKPPNGDRLEKQITVTRTLIDATAEEARSHNTTIHLVIVPTRSDVDPNRPLWYRPEDGERYWAVQREMLRNATLENDNVYLLDLEPDLRAEMHAGKRVYHDEDPHLTEYGYRVTAREIYRKMVETGDLNDSNPNFSKEYDNDVSTCP